ncbi:hypothetical protein FKR81_28280 [Lentzea tibetensis]|uniref:ATP-grasp domain-containing protein n=1 Tax=Lentzea tibetensis TaxID=2591470 RepID=A0A563EMQ6_9PSEU|nr:hypothetical protein [Lentzea tibetensis]TWP48489.1 hypothetical protein FKR81_28280 [Lentzea tibetensis]
MRIAVLCKKDLRAHPVGSWLAGHDVALFAAQPPPSTAGFGSVEVFDDWKANRAVDLAVVAAHRRRPFDRIVALSECDLVRAGELRDLLGVSGMDTRSAVAFRDKVVMKRLAAEAGLATPEFARVDTVWDLLDFAAGRDRVVVKPVDGSGALDVTVLSRDELTAWAAARRTPWDSSAGLVVEQHVDAPMVLVDGVMAAGDVLVRMVSRYVGTCHGLVAGLQPLGVVGLDDDDPVAVRAAAYVERLVKAMPGPQEPTSFHCELFDVPGEDVVLCEITARTGGGRINDQARIALGVDLERWSCLGQAGITDLPRENAQAAAGFVLLPAPGGRVTRMPATCPVSGVVDWRPHVVAGQRLERTRKASALAADVLFTADDPAGLVPVHDEVVRWLGEQIAWDLR